MRAMAIAYWLMKSEPDVFGIEHLKRKGTAPWDGVRNFQARNNMRAMKIGDRILFHHSSAKPTGIAGLATVVKEAYPDHTAWNPKSEYFDPKSTPDKPLWFMVEVRYEHTFPRILTIEELRTVPELGSMVLLNNSRLSVQPVRPEEFRLIVKMAGKAK
jgi:predicted RNA-binding protein with PUA-like domain